MDEVSGDSADTRRSSRGFQVGNEPLSSQLHTVMTRLMANIGKSSIA